jgi:hypothetical protein
MIRGIDRKPYIDLDPYLDISKFKDLHPEIAKGFACAREFAKEGTWMKPNFKYNDMSYTLNWKPIYQAYDEFLNLPDTDPIKIEGLKILPTNFKDFKQRNIFVRYLKTTMGAHDPYIYYFLWEDTSNMSDRGESERPPTPEQKYFPGVVEWVNNLKQQGIVEHIGRVLFFVSESSSKPFEHRDIDHSVQGDQNGYSNHTVEFIHIRPFTKRGFYVWDPEQKKKTYINSHASFFNDQDWHGGEFSMEQEYGLRIDCKFTDEFKKKIRIQHLDHY